MIKQRAMELVAALRSGEYPQEKGYLKTDNGYCCLGVACEISGLGTWNKSTYTVTAVTDHADDRNSLVLPRAVQHYFGFGNLSGARRDRDYIFIGHRHYESLTAANDKGGASFAEIADFIEQNWEHL